MTRRTYRWAWDPLLSSLFLSTTNTVEQEDALQRNPTYKQARLPLKEQRYLSVQRPTTMPRPQHPGGGRRPAGPPQGGPPPPNFGFGLDGDDMDGADFDIAHEGDESDPDAFGPESDLEGGAEAAEEEEEEVDQGRMQEHRDRHQD
ncbi:MAG: hypothetical protein Q9208_008415 [Pyrenodesmia sp. 3 TL-2023]